MLDAESRNGRTEKHDERRSMKKLERLGDDARPRDAVAKTPRRCDCENERLDASYQRYDNDGHIVPVPPVCGPVPPRDRIRRVGVRLFLARRM